MGDLRELLEKFRGQPLVVLGDLVADEYVHGTTSRISREAPVLIVREDGREIRMGGAANVVANLRALGGLPRPVGLMGEDSAGQALRQAISELEIPDSGIVSDPDRITTCKTRVLAGGRNTVRQQMLRLDRLNPNPVTSTVQDLLLERLRSSLGGAAGLVVSDYGEGVVEGVVRDEVLRIGASGELPVFVDSRFRIGEYPRVATLTPNEPELSAASGRKLAGLDSLEAAGRWLLESSGADSVLVKRGRNGMALFEAGENTTFVEAFGSAEVADVTGAGDTVLAAWALARAAGVQPVDAMRLANAAGGLQVTKAGTAVVSMAEMSAALAD